MLKDEEIIRRIEFIQPDSLIENILFMKKLLEKDNLGYDLIVLDSLLGSPFQTKTILKTERKKWEKNVFSFLLDLKHIAIKHSIPIIITLNLTEESPIDLVLIDPFITLKVNLIKIYEKISMKLNIFNQYVGSSDVKLYFE